MQLNKGDIIIGEFKILDIFGGEGKSGMGVVYLVESRHFPIPFILKTYQSNSNNSTQRFFKEAKAWINIGIHENIVQAIFADTINDQLFIGAEFIEKDQYGRNTISDYLEKGGVSIQNIVKWIVQFCRGSNHALKNGLKSHRDIKPDNLMVDVNGNLKITDFGLSKFEKELGNVVNQKNIFANQIRNILSKKPTEENLLMTQKGSFIGTLLYSSPEQILDSSSVDFRSDIYSFGIVLYQLITLGAYPYSTIGRTTIEELALMHLQEPIIKFNHPLYHIVEKCLQRTPKERFQSFEELLNSVNKTAIELKISIPADENKNKNHQLKETYIKAYSSLAFNDVKTAKAYIYEYLKQDENDSSALLLAGRIEYHLNNYEKALDFTLKAYKQNPLCSKTCNNLGLLYKEKGVYDKAEKFYLKAFEIDPLNSGALSNLSIYQLSINRFKEASENIIKALEIAPDKKDSLFNANNIGASLVQNGEFEGAKKIFELITKLSPIDANAWFNLGLIYESKNTLMKAVKCYQQVEKIKPKDKEALTRIIKLIAFMAIEMEHLDNLKLAIHYCDKLIDYKIEPLKAISWKAQYLQLMGYGSEAINVLKTAIKYNANSDSLFLSLANIFGLENQKENAIEYLDLAKSLMIKNGNNSEENMLIIKELERKFK